MARGFSLAPCALLLLAPLAPAEPSQAGTPDTPAGRRFAGWLEAFNRADRGELERFLKEHYPKNSNGIDDELAFREMTGGFDLRKVEESETTRVSGILQARDTGNFARFVLEVDEAEPHAIRSLDIRRIRRPSDVPPPPRLTEAEAIAALREALTERSGRDRFAGTVGIARGGKPVFLEAYGLADREKKEPNRVDTRFRLGSMNKMFTAVAVAQLVEAGKATLQDPIGKHLADYPEPEVARKVTLHHLLTHTGGTGDIFGPEFDRNRSRLRELKDYVALYGGRGLAFEPGSRFAYSNYGYLLLGVLVERLSGESYYEYVRRHVYEPARMTRTASASEEERVEDRSVGYMRAPGGRLEPNTATLPYRGTSAGGGYSTVEDLLRFADALTGRKLLTLEATGLLTSGKVEIEEGRRCGYGFFEVSTGGVRYFGHGGGAPGMNGDLRIFPDSGYVVVVLSNLDPPAASYVADFLTDRLPAR